MRITDSARPWFDAASQTRGRRYHQDRCVDLLQLRGGMLECSVGRDEVFEVDLAISIGSIEWPGTCTCETFAQRGACAHLWAAIEAADALDASELRALGCRFDTAANPLAPPGELPARVPDTPWAELLEPKTRLCYLLQRDDSEASGFTLCLYRQVRLDDRSWDNPIPLTDPAELCCEMGSVDQQILTRLLGSGPERHDSAAACRPLCLHGEQLDAVLPLLDLSQRWFAHRNAARTDQPLRLDTEPPFHFEFDLWRDKSAERIHLWGALHRQADRGDAETLAIEDLLMAGDAYFVTKTHAVVKLIGQGVPRLVDSLRRDGSIQVPFEREEQLQELLARIPWHERQRPAAPSPADAPVLRGHVRIDAATAPASEACSEYPCVLSYLYGQIRIDAGDGRASFLAAGRHEWFELPNGQRLRRDLDGERRLLQEFLAAGGRASDQRHDSYQGRIPGAAFPRLVKSLLARQWIVEANGQRVLEGDDFRGAVQSGIDWLALQGSLQFGDQALAIPELLAAVRRGQRLVELPNGGLGILSDEWFERLASLARLGRAGDNSLRFRINQAWVLDAMLLAEQGSRVEVDAAFAELRQRIRDFDGFRPIATPEGFCGNLRPYQEAALGWLRGLDRLGLGGCLADDMGLGKTVQILAHLHQRYRIDACRQPTLIVAPSSLVFNWSREAARFSPELRVLAHIGAQRARGTAALLGVDLVITTYGTMRRDLDLLRQIEFDHVILDEAQAIKNGRSLTAKACRLLSARQRLALSGTPIENHIGELWSLFEFLNPGMLGRNFDRKSQTVADRNSERSPAERHHNLARAIRPFFLRRTKQQVLAELPEKVEQTLYCHLDPSQRGDYDRLKQHFQASLLGPREASDEPAANQQINILSALLRLRQAACHVGLIDARRRLQGSAKLDVLLPMLQQLAASGHKALVFSQFTSLLGIVRDELSTRGIGWRYLDGSTVDRDACVDEFQNDPRYPVFLISIKAGGAGLNLTAADYVFLLDPWWNPAVEAQAIDRSHRMGQQRPVTAYRLIAKDTVEEHVLDLQASKRELAEALLGPDNAVLRGLSRNDLLRLLT